MLRSRKSPSSSCLFKSFLLYFHSTPILYIFWDILLWLIRTNSTARFSSFNPSHLLYFSPRLYLPFPCVQFGSITCLLKCLNLVQILSSTTFSDLCSYIILSLNPHVFFDSFSLFNSIQSPDSQDVWISFNRFFTAFSVLITWFSRCLNLVQLVSCTTFSVFLSSIFLHFHLPCFPQNFSATYSNHLT